MNYDKDKVDEMVLGLLYLTITEEALQWAIHFDLTTFGNDNAECSAMQNNPDCPVSFSLIDFTHC